MPGADLMKNILARFRADEFGATAIEYAILARLIALGIVAGASTLGTSLGAVMNNVSGKL